MRQSTYKLLQHAFSHQPVEEVDLHQTAGRSTHPGHTSVELFYFMLRHKELFNLFSPIMDKHIVVEAGAGPGYFSMMSSLILMRGRQRRVIALEKDQGRNDRLVNWVNMLINDHGYSRQSLPVVRCGDFTKDDVPEFEQGLRNRRLLIYLNNYNEALSGLGGPEEKLADKLGRCKIGSVLIALGPFFHRDMNWREERYVVIVPNDHISWTMNDTAARKELTIFKYTKVMDEEANLKKHRQRCTSVKKLRYSFLRNSMFG